MLRFGLRYIKILHVIVLVAYLSGVGILLQYLIAPPIQVALASDPATYDLADSNNYHARFNGASSNTYFGYYLTAADLNNNGIADLLLASPNSNNVYIVYDTSYASLTTKGNSFDFSNTANWNIRFDTPTASWGTGLKAADIDNDGKNDLIISEDYASTQGRTQNGAVFVIYNTLIDDYTGTGNVVNLGTSSNYNLRFDGASTNDYFGFNEVKVGDIDNDNKTDLFVGCWGCSYNSRTNSASMYVIKNTLMDDYTGTGNTIDMATSSNYNMRFDGSATQEFIASGSGAASGDLNGNGANDFVIGALLYNEGSDGRVYVIYDSILSTLTGTGNNVDLATSTNYNIRYTGSGNNVGFAYYTLFTADVNGDGVKDLVVDDYLGSGNKGNLYIIYSTLIDDYAGTGNNVVLSSSSYNMRFKGPPADSGYGYVFSSERSFVDFNNNGSPDFILNAPYANSATKSEPGSIYVVYDSIFNSLTGTGNELDLASTSSYSLRTIGPTATKTSFGIGDYTHDFNNDGTYDLLIPQSYENAAAGSVFMIFNFPHTVNVTALGATVNTANQTVTGTVSASNSLSTIANVEYSVDTATFTGTWTSCTASDGSFNSTSEDYSCSVTLPSEGSHTIRVRAKDSNGVYTAVSHYGSTTTNYSLGASPTPTPSPSPSETVTPTPTPTPAPASTTISYPLVITKIGGVPVSPGMHSFTYYGKFPVFTGTATPGSIVSLKGKVSGGESSTLCTATAGSKGVWQCKSIELSPGEYEVAYSATKDSTTTTGRTFTLTTLDETLQTSTEENASSNPAAQSSASTGSVAFNSSQSTRVELTTAPTGEKAVSLLSMLITDRTGQPLSNQSVTLASNPQTVTTDSKGVARFANVPIGRHELSYVTPDNQKVAVGLTISVAQQSNGTPIALTLEVQPITVPLPFFNSKWQPWIAIILLLPAFGFMVWIVYKELQARNSMP